MTAGVLGQAGGLFLGALFESSDDSIFLMTGTRFVECNPATLRMYGCPRREDILGQTPARFSPARQPDGSDSAERASELVAAALAGHPQRFEWRHCQLDRTEFDVEVRLSRVEVGRDALVLAVVRDISARKRAEAALLQEKQFSERLLDSLPGIFFLYDEDLHLRRWNKNHETVMGYSAEELRGKSLGDWHRTEENRTRAVTAVRRVLEHGGGPDFLESELLHKDGSMVPYLLSSVRVDSPFGPAFMGVGVSIAERVAAERQLAASERNYREIFNATLDGLVIHDESGRVLEINDRACAMFGIEREQAGKLTINDLSLGEPPFSQHEAIEKIRLAVREGPQVFPWRSRRRDGTLFWSEVAVRSALIGGERRVIASVRDVTARVTAETERERLIAEAQAANSAKDQFLAVLSHELRNPLAAIQAGVDAVRHAPGLDTPRAQHVLDIIARNVALQARLMDDLLDLSRLARGDVTMRRSPVPLDPVVLSTTEASRADFARADLGLETRAESGAWVDADVDRLQQIVINLLRNALKFTPAGGRISVSTAATDERARVVVEDTGIGIDRARLSDIFQMFRRDSWAASRAPGLGIGLALVKSLTELHGGRVWAESAGPGLGSRFTVELPRCAAPRVPVALSAPTPERRPIKVLVVEDNPDTRFLLAEAFQDLGYRVVAADSAEAALDLLRRESVDAILADIGLPGIDGYEFLRQARALPAAAFTPALALTGFGQDSDRRRARAAGYLDHFVKPVDVAEIDRRIRERLPQAQASL